MWVHNFFLYPTATGIVRHWQLSSAELFMKGRDERFFFFSVYNLSVYALIESIHTNVVVSKGWYFVSLAVDFSWIRLLWSLDAFDAENFYSFADFYLSFSCSYDRVLNIFFFFFFQNYPLIDIQVVLNKTVELSREMWVFWAFWSIIYDTLLLTKFWV